MPMKCHYEILCVQRDASDEELKKSYRKLALKWHPDKNPGQEEECTAQFRSIQTAYDVLSDPQERAWYDKHREAILKGGLGHGDKYEDNSLNVFQYFNAGCYSGYGDDENGFFSVYREVFKTIATEDYEFMDDREEGWEMPDFGDSQSSYDDVVHLFYSYWESYCTAKSYVWVEKYDTREGPNRQIRRLMEADNKKLRDKAKKERNEEVRALVAFVRKRDKRVQAQKKRLEERAAEVARRTVERQEQQKRERLKNLEQYKETEWSAMSELEGDLAQLEAHFAEQFGDAHSEENSNSEIEEEDQFLDDLLCVACNKAFKSDRAFANHEKSKKHRENVALIKAEMEADDIDLDTVITGLDSVSIHTDDFVVDTNSKAKLSKKQKKKRKQQIQLQQSENEEEDDTIDVSKNVDQKDSSTEAESPTITQDDFTVIDDLESKSKSLTEQTKQESQGIHCSCNTCLKKFPSKTKLFDHLKATGHALRLEEPAKENNPNLRGKKKKVPTATLR